MEDVSGWEKAGLAFMFVVSPFLVVWAIRDLRDAKGMDRATAWSEIVRFGLVVLVALAFVIRLIANWLR
jgi:hypothetical protein